MSPDLKLATVYVMPLGGQDVAPVIAALNRNQKFIRGEIARAVNLKYAPEIVFREDESFEEATRIDHLLDSDKVRRDVKGENEVNHGTTQEGQSRSTAGSCSTSPSG